VKELADHRLAIVGVGNVGRILLARLMTSGVPPERLVICDADPTRAASAAKDWPVKIATLTDPEVCSAEVVLLAVPPKAVPDVLRKLTVRLHPGQLVVSFAATVPLSLLESLVPVGVSVARVMPNAPSLVGQGMNPVVYSDLMDPSWEEVIEAILATLGDWIEVDDGQMNWCVGLTGATMRTILPASEGLVRAAEMAGFPPQDARRLAAQALRGTAALLSETALPLEDIKNLTPMETVDEAALSQLIFEATRGAKERVDRLEMKIISG
jgi:pyrroline-5-carboxylate reductase